MNYMKIIFGMFAFFISSFVIQGILASVIAGEYFESISVFRNPPIFIMAMAQTALSGLAVAALYQFSNFEGTPLLRGFKFGLLMGVIIVPFIALDLPARFEIPSIGTWISIQGILGFAHCVLAGILIGLINGKHKK